MIWVIFIIIITIIIITWSFVDPFAVPNEFDMRQEYTPASDQRVSSITSIWLFAVKKNRLLG